jgi:hypothetical protein
MVILDPKRTHILWAGRRMGRRKVELLECGAGWIDTRGRVHTGFDRTPFDNFTGYIQLAPRGAEAELPLIEPARPSAGDAPEDDPADVLDRMLTTDEKFTHLLYGGRRVGRRYGVELLECGVGWIDAQGVPHAYFNRTPFRSFTGYSQMVVRGETPELPPKELSKPDASNNDAENSGD